MLTATFGAHHGHHGHHGRRHGGHHYRVGDYYHSTCPMVYAPVLADDDRIYDNECWARLVGRTVVKRLPPGTKISTPGMSGLGFVKKSDGGIVKAEGALRGASSLPWSWIIGGALASGALGVGIAALTRGPRSLGYLSEKHASAAEGFVNESVRKQRLAADAANRGDCYEALNVAKQAYVDSRIAAREADASNDRSLRRSAIVEASNAALRFDSILRVCVRPHARGSVWARR